MVRKLFLRKNQMENIISDKNIDNEKIENESIKTFKEPSIRNSLKWIFIFMLAQIAGVTTAILVNNLAMGLALFSKENLSNPMVMISGILLGGVPIIAARYKYLKNMLHYKKDNNLLFMGIASVAIIIVLSYIYKEFIIPGRNMQPDLIIFIKAINSGVLGIILTYLAVGIVAPILEEILFRGQLQGAIANKLKFKNINNSGIYAIILTSLLFAVIHFQPLAMPLLFLGGMVMGYLRYKTNSLFLPIVVHLLINTTSVTLMLINEIS